MIDSGNPGVYFVYFCGHPVSALRFDVRIGLVEIPLLDMAGRFIRYPDGSLATAELRGPVTFVPAEEP